MAMIVDLIRHGAAAPAGQGGDAARPLSPAGEAGVAALARALAERRWAPDRVFASPLLRARRTAALLARAAAPAREPETLEALGPAHEPPDVLADLAAHEITTGHVALVGHMPQLGRLLATLAREERPFAPAQLWRVSLPQGLEPGSGRIEFTLGAGA